MAEAIELLGKLGVSQSQIAIDARLNPATLSKLKSGQGLADYHIEPVRKAVHSRALKLRRAPANRERLHEIIKQCGISMRKLADDMGVSRQALHQWLTTEDWSVNPKRIEEVQAKLREIGEILYSKSGKDDI